MPWKLSDAFRKTHKATNAPLRRQWTSTANSVLARTGDEAKAVRIANSAVKKSKGRKKKVLQ
jgi:hypothetical protein